MPRGTWFGVESTRGEDHRPAVPGRLVMNALQYESLYHKLTVSLDELGTTTVDVHHYKNNGEAYVNSPLYGTTEAVKRKDLLNVQINAEVRALQQKAAAKPKPSEVMDM